MPTITDILTHLAAIDSTFVIALLAMFAYQFRADIVKFVQFVFNLICIGDGDSYVR